MYRFFVPTSSKLSWNVAEENFSFSFFKGLHDHVLNTPIQTIQFAQRISIIFWSRKELLRPKKVSDCLLQVKYREKPSNAETTNQSSSFSWASPPLPRPHIVCIRSLQLSHYMMHSSLKYRKFFVFSFPSLLQLLLCNGPWNFWYQLRLRGTFSLKYLRSFSSLRSSFCFAYLFNFFVLIFASALVFTSRRDPLGKSLLERYSPPAPP